MSSAGEPFVCSASHEGRGIGGSKSSSSSSRARARAGAVAVRPPSGSAFTRATRVLHLGCSDLYIHNMSSAGEPVGCRAADEGRGRGSSSSSGGGSGDAPNTVWEIPHEPRECCIPHARISSSMTRASRRLSAGRGHREPGHTGCGTRAVHMTAPNWRTGGCCSRGILDAHHASSAGEAFGCRAADEGRGSETSSSISGSGISSPPYAI